MFQCKFAEGIEKMKRIGTLSKLKPGAADAYIKLHDEIWQGVVDAGHEANMRNFSIFRIGDYLFSYYEYIGDDFEADMAKKSALPISIEWQKATGEFREIMDGENRFIEIEEIWHHDF